MSSVFPLLSFPMFILAAFHPFYFSHCFPFSFLSFVFCSSSRLFILCFLFSQCFFFPAFYPLFPVFATVIPPSFLSLVLCFSVYPTCVLIFISCLSSQLFILCLIFFPMLFLPALYPWSYVFPTAFPPSSSSFVLCFFLCFSCRLSIRFSFFRFI